MKEKNITVNESDTLFNILKSNFSDLSNKKIKSFIKYKMVEVDDVVVTNSNLEVGINSVVKVTFSKKVIDEVDIDIIYEDKDIIVIDKPAGLLSISNKKEKNATAFRLVSDYIKKDKKTAKLFVVHRLDQATSGVLMFAKNEKTKEMFQKNWSEIVKLREYYAVCEGKTLKEETIESYLTMNHFQIVYSTKDKSLGWYAKTHYKTLKQNAKYSLVLVDISTGRRNQIRVHMSEGGHPIVGDKKYGAKNNPIGRLALHASRLELVDPRTKKLVFFKAPAPPEIIDLVK